MPPRGVKPGTKRARQYLNIEGRSRMNKAELVHALRKG